MIDLGLYLVAGHNEMVSNNLLEKKEHQSHVATTENLA